MGLSCASFIIPVNGKSSRSKRYPFVLVVGLCSARRKSMSETYSGSKLTAWKGISKLGRRLNQGEC
jgi:hypothetical protein